MRTLRSALACSATSRSRVSAATYDSSVATTKTSSDPAHRVQLDDVVEPEHPGGRPDRRRGERDEDRRVAQRLQRPDHHVVLRDEQQQDDQQREHGAPVAGRQGQQTEHAPDDEERADRGGAEDPGERRDRDEERAGPGRPRLPRRRAPGAARSPSAQCVVVIAVPTAARRRPWLSGIGARRPVTGLALDPLRPFDGSAPGCGRSLGSSRPVAGRLRPRGRTRRAGRPPCRRVRATACCGRRPRTTRRPSADRRPSPRSPA